MRSGHWRTWPVYEVLPKGPRRRLTIVYFHGGAYMDEITIWHWLTIAEIVRRTGARCLVPIYPLLPRASAVGLVAEATDYVREHIAGPDGDPTVFMGDSAGGGLALASALCLRDEGSRQPSRLVLFSPFLDVTVGDDRQVALERKDKLLRRPGLAEAGRLYAGDLPLDDPRVSPVFGDLKGLAPVTVFTGTHDILDIDSRRLAERAAECGLALDLHEAAGAPHAYAVFPTPQGAAARSEVATACRRLAEDAQDDDGNSSPP